MVGASNYAPVINHKVMDSSVLEERDFGSQDPGFEPHQNDLLEQLMNPELPLSQYFHQLEIK